jgi:hypothetical protein
MEDNEIIEEVLKEFASIGQEQDEFIGNYYPIVSGLMQKALAMQFTPMEVGK